MFELCCPASKPIGSSFVSFFLYYGKCLYLENSMTNPVSRAGRYTRLPINQSWPRGNQSWISGKALFASPLAMQASGTSVINCKVFLMVPTQGVTNIFIIKNFDNQQMIGRVCCLLATAKSFSGKLVAFLGISAPKQAPIQLVMTYCLARCLFWARALPQKLELLSPFWATEASRGHPAQIESFSTVELSMAHLQEKSTKASWIHIEARLFQDSINFSLCPHCLKHTPLLRSRSKLSHHPGRTGGNYCYNLANTQYRTIESTSFLHKIVMTCTTPVPSRPKTCCRKEWPSEASGTLRLDSRFPWKYLYLWQSYIILYNICSVHLRTGYAI